VLHHEHRVARIHQPLEHVEEFLDVCEMQPRRRLVEDVERLARAGLGELAGELHPLCLAARELRRRLAERDIAEPHIDERAKNPRDLRRGLEELVRVGHAHLEHVGDALAMPLRMERLGRVAAALAGLALHPHVGQEVHLHAALAEALAGFAAATIHIEAEGARREPAGARLGHLCVELADVVEHAGVGGRRRAGRRADRLLINEDHLVDLIEPLHGIVLPGLLTGRVQPAGQGPPQHFEHERRFPGAARARHGREHAQRKPGVEPFERAMADAPDLEPLLGHPAARQPLLLEHGIAGSALLQIRPRHAGPRRRELRGRGMGHDHAPLAAAARAEVEGMVGRVHDVAIMLHDDERVAQVAELAHRPDQAMRVARMEADRRLVEHVEHAREAAAHLGGEANPLELASRQAPCRPGHVEILEADIDEKVHA